MPEPTRPRRRIRAIGEAAALGALHGPAELLPISSSGHVELIPWLLGWERGSLAADERKSFEVALHAGTAAALLHAVHREVFDHDGNIWDHMRYEPRPAYAREEARPFTDVREWTAQYYPEVSD